MPTYDYVCDACKHAFEEFQAMSAKQLKKCPECGKPKLRRLIGTGAGVIFKGSGFYETDYRSDSYKKSADADKPGESKPEKSESTGSTTPSGDAKPSSAASSEGKPAKAEVKSEKPAPQKNGGKGKAKD